MANKPYNPLSQILSSGGSIALGLAYAFKWSKDKVSGLFARRFEPMLPDDKSQLIQIAMQGVRAAELFNQLPPDEQIDPDLVPTNPYLFGQSNDGRRVLTISDYSGDDGSTRIQDRIETPDMPTPEDIMNRMLDEAWEVERENYERIANMMGEKAAFDWWKTLYIEKAF